MRPRENTSARWQICATSSKSVETTITVSPLSRARGNQAGRFPLSHQHPHPPSDPRRSAPCGPWPASGPTTTFCWLPPDKASTASADHWAARPTLLTDGERLPASADGDKKDIKVRPMASGLRNMFSRIDSDRATLSSVRSRATRPMPCASATCGEDRSRVCPSSVTGPCDPARQTGHGQWLPARRRASPPDPVLRLAWPSGKGLLDEAADIAGLVQRRNDHGDALRHPHLTRRKASSSCWLGARSCGEPVSTSPERAHWLGARSCGEPVSTSPERAH